MRDEMIQKAERYLKTLCVDIDSRAVGTEGNRRATAFLAQQLEGLDWPVQASRFTAMDWHDDGATLRCGRQEFSVFASPYSLGCELEAELREVATVAELEASDVRGKILLLHGELAKEQIMPKNFVFYNPEEHRRIVDLLERSGARALVCATGYNPLTAGGVYPFPLFEDGDFDIPSLFMTETEGKRLLAYAGQKVQLRSRCRRVPGYGENILAHRGPADGERIVVSAHIDAKKGTPGAIDNATGVIILLLLAEMLRDYRGARQVELAAFNGEDYYAVPGQMLYLAQNRERFASIVLNINIDGAGYYEGGSCFSLFDLPPRLERAVREVMAAHPVLSEGVQWVQGDHSIFVQQGCPAVAVSSRWFLEHMYDQHLTHTPQDKPDIVACPTLVDTARAVADLIGKVGT